MLSSQEQQIWDDVLRFWAEEAEEPPRATPSRRRGSSSDEAELPIAVVAGMWITITLILFGVMSAALTVGVATALGWALWHNWPGGMRHPMRPDDQQTMVVTRTVPGAAGGDLGGAPPGVPERHSGTRRVTSTRHWSGPSWR